jgi:hypothetical protein
MQRAGSCLRGAVTVEAETLQACHCAMCRKWGDGGPFMAIACRDATVSGPVARYASSDGAERGSCSGCGWCLFFHPVRRDIHAIPIALFDDQSGLPVRHENPVDDQPDCYAFANETRRPTGDDFATRARGG